MARREISLEDKQAWMRERHTAPVLGDGLPDITAFERHFTSKELAGLWRFDESTIRRMFQDISSSVLDHKETAEKLEPHCRHSKEVHRYDRRAVVLEKGRPTLLWVPASPNCTWIPSRASVPAASGRYGATRTSHGGKLQNPSLRRSGHDAAVDRQHDSGDVDRLIGGEE